MHRGPAGADARAFLDRRSFLVSYDPATDPEGDVLKGLLAAAMPVCAGISLEYYFSRVDNSRYGAGTKLPHNPTGLVGVMDGYQSDLRNGLPWQTVEIHEPMRLFTVIEAERETIRRVIARLPDVEGLLKRRWLYIAQFDAVTGETAWYDGERFHVNQEAGAVLPRAPSSRAYYAGHRGHLAPATLAEGGHAN
jgi:uncharacterized protein YbcC (UPF0753/DUF2309 family)